jgi:hypothetical protein
MVLVAPKCSHIVLPSFGHVRRESQRKQFLERRPFCRSIPPASEDSETTHNSPDANPEHANNSTTSVVGLNPNKRLAVLKASKSASRPIKQLDKPLGMYCVLYDQIGLINGAINKELILLFPADVSFFFEHSCLALQLII